MRKTETIKRDIERAEARIAKNTESIARLTTRKENALKKLEKAGYVFKGDGTDGRDCPVEVYDPCYTAQSAIESIANKEKSIAEDKAALVRLNEELAEVQAKIDAIPQAIKDYEGKLYESLLADSKERRNWARQKLQELKESGKLLCYGDVWKASRSGSYEDLKRLKAQYELQERCEVLSRKTDEELDKEAKWDARCLIMDLAFRVNRCVGTATDCSGLYIEEGTDGCAVLNGIVVGEKGRCEVVSHGVAGYNIVRWHIRVNVWPIK